MAIVREDLQNGLVRTYSDAGFKVHGGVPESDYNVVYDPADTDREYTETDIPVDVPGIPGNDLSKRNLMNAFKRRGLWDAVKQYMQTTDDLWDQWEASTTLEANDGLIRKATTALKEALGLSDADVNQILTESVAK